MNKFMTGLQHLLTINLLMTSHIVITFLVLLLVPNALSQSKPISGAISGSSDFSGTTQADSIDTTIQQKQTCEGQGPLNMAFRLSSYSSYYLTHSTLFSGGPSRYLRISNDEPNSNSLFTASQKTDCTWSFVTKDGLYITDNPSNSLLVIVESVQPQQGLILKFVENMVEVRSASNQDYAWGIEGSSIIWEKKLASSHQFVMELQPKSYDAKKN